MCAFYGYNPADSATCFPVYLLPCKHMLACPLIPRVPFLLLAPHMRASKSRAH